MTTATVSVFKVAQLCNKALEATLRRLKACEEVVDVDEEYDKSQLITGNTLRSVTLACVKSEHYKNLNFVLRLQELCGMISDPLANPKIEISLEDFSRLISLTNPTKVYSTRNPYNGNFPD